MKHTTLILLILFTCVSVLAQKPKYVPFQYQGQTGMMDTSGIVFFELGSLDNYYLVIGDFKEYIVGGSRFEGSDFFISAVSGKGGFSGILDRECGKMKVGKHTTFYHFWIDGISNLFSPEKGLVRLGEHYQHIEPNEQAWDNENDQDHQFLWALKADGTYDVLDANKDFTVVKNLPSFYSYDLIFHTSEANPMKLIGFVVGDKDAINREFGQIYEIPPSEKQVEVYDVQFNRLGSSAYHSKEISALFKKEIGLRGSMLAPPEPSYIYPQGRKILLNEEFGLIPKGTNNDRLILVNTKKNNEPVLGNSDFDYRYINSSKNLRALLQIRHQESGSIFYFDFDGTFFPRGVPMIPADKREWE